MNETVKLQGAFTVELRDSNGMLKDHRDVKNVVVTVGKSYLTQWLVASSQSGFFMQYVAVGTGTSAAQASDTALQAEVARVAGTLSNSTNVWQNQAVFGPGIGTGAVTEAGILSASSSGTLLAHQVFAAVNKAAGDTLTIVWQITFS